MAISLNLNITPDEAAQLITDNIVNGSFTGEVIDSYTVSSDDDKKCIVIVMEKHYYRAGNRLTLTLVIDNLSGTTRVHGVSGGGGEGLFRFDWGASDSFENCIRKAVTPYIIYNY